RRRACSFLRCWRWSSRSASGSWSYGGPNGAARRVQGYSVQDSHRGGRMRKLGAMAATGTVLALALAAWTHQPPRPEQGGGTISGKVKFAGTKPAMPKIDMTEEPKCKAKYQGVPTEETVVVNPNGRSEEHTSELQSRGHLVCRL